ncbi:MAG: radical SAM family heme chaperone HemW [Myxococcales bacterium]|nr:radical SAM family heme chaperone HemW [Myxococcales bacterium]
MKASISGLYIHIPFCPAKCGYCAFNSQPLPDEATLDRYLTALETELVRQQNFLAGARLKTIYFGGGTPSLAEPKRLRRILDHVFRLIDPRSRPEEITLESNPVTLQADRLKGFRQAGINRLTIGVQSFDLAALTFMECAYRSPIATQGFETARQAGFDNIGLDFIVGLPQPHDEVYRADLKQATELAPNHLSVYLLTVDEPSHLFERVKRGEIVPLGDDRQAEIFLDCHDILSRAGYDHYEVSSYARPGFRSRHNSLYWTGEYYLGLGAGAHSYLEIEGRPVRRANVTNADRYMDLMARDQEPLDFTETLTPAIMARERIMLALRTKEGLAPADFGSLEDRLILSLTPHARDGLIAWDGRRFRPTPAGMLIADGVAERLWDLIAD